MRVFIGATGILSFTTAKPSGTAYDPTDLKVTVRAPSQVVGGGTVYTYVGGNPLPITRLSLGSFEMGLPHAEAGRYHYRIRSVDPADGRIDIAEGSYTVEHSRVVSNAA
jgi:hypothetical protein